MIPLLLVGMESWIVGAGLRIGTVIVAIRPCREDVDREYDCDDHLALFCCSRGSCDHNDGGGSDDVGCDCINVMFAHVSAEAIYVWLRIIL